MPAPSEFGDDSADPIAWAEPPDSMRAALEQDPPDPREHPLYSFSLFWRTFLLLGLLLLGSAIGWYWLLRTFEYEPRVVDNARQVASLVRLSRMALAHADPSTHAALIQTLAQQEQISILPRRPGEPFDPFDQNGQERRLSAELLTRLGPDTVVARQVNGKPGLWVSFSIDGAPYWLMMDRSHIDELIGDSTWLLWLATLVILSLLGAAVLARLINQPLQRLLRAAVRVRQGNFQKPLDESVRVSEIRAVNIGFNRMANRISQIERNRAEMLAGISHDLRTPLARLRLETEMSVPEPQARELMVADIAQVDAVIEKFLDYARPGRNRPRLLPLAELARACAQPFAAREDMQVRIDIPPGLRVLGDEVELSRVFSNLLENARNYGKTPGTQITRVRMAAIARNQKVKLRVRDYGPGVPPERLSHLTRPFYRGDNARTSATGTGLGLAIVAKVVQGMGGTVEFGNGQGGGLIALIQLPQATPPEPPRQGRASRFRISRA